MMFFYVILPDFTLTIAFFYVPLHKIPTHRIITNDKN
jgi:hypothetical protein